MQGKRRLNDGHPVRNTAPGGGAVANAEAQGVAFQALAAIMGM